jgi:hypothetical protein
MNAPLPDRFVSCGDIHTNRLSQGLILPKRWLGKDYLSMPC